MLFSFFKGTSEQDNTTSDPVRANYGPLWASLSYLVAYFKQKNKNVASATISEINIYNFSGNMFLMVLGFQALFYLT